MQKNRENEGGPAGPDLTPPDERFEPVTASTPPTELDGENLAGVLSAVFDKAKALGIDPDLGFEKVRVYLAGMGAWNRHRAPETFAALERARTAGDHLAMLDAAHEIAERAKAKASTSTMVWDAIVPLLKKVFLSALV